jgi:capsular exopolysaccharide synthesis family protein
MEKLQKALEKARSIRSSSASTMRRGTQTLSPEQNELWQSVAPMKLSAQDLAANRVFLQDNIAGIAPYDVLRTRLREIARKQNLKRVAITSPEAQAGKSTTLANLALSLGRLDFLRTIVFDFDLRRPSLHKLLAQKPTANMGTLIQGDVPFEEHMLRVNDNLIFGLNSGAVANSSELLQGNDTIDFLHAVEETFAPDMMLFDMPPFLAADDTHGFLSNIDGVILVVEAENTTISQIDAVEEQLSKLTNVIGVVLNKCNFANNEIDSSYGYY